MNIDLMPKAQLIQELYRIKSANARLVKALNEIHEMIDGRIDVIDGEHGNQLSNLEMSISTIIQKTLSTSEEK